MSKNKELELMLETYRGLITDDEQITARISHQDRKREKLQRQQAKIYEDMAAVEERIRELLGSPDADELDPPRDKRRGRRKKVELTEEEVVSCEKLAEELMGGK